MNPERPPAGDAAPSPVGEPWLLALAALPGFDLATGLRHLGGSTRAYLRVVRLFEQHHAADVARLQALACGGERAPLAAAVHGLAGAAGTLGAKALAAECRRWLADAQAVAARQRDAQAPPKPPPGGRPVADALAGGRAEPGEESLARLPFNSPGADAPAADFPAVEPLAQALAAVLAALREALALAASGADAADGGAVARRKRPTAPGIPAADRGPGPSPLPPDPPHQRPPACGPVPSAPIARAARWQRLRDLLASHDTSAADWLEAEAADLAPLAARSASGDEEPADAWARLQQQVQAYDFEAALQTLDAWRSAADLSSAPQRVDPPQPPGPQGPIDRRGGPEPDGAPSPAAPIHRPPG